MRDSRLLAKERSIVGSLLDSTAGVIPPTITKLLRLAPESFEDQRVGLIAREIFRFDGAPIHTLSVQDALEKNGALEKAGGALFVAGLVADAVPLALAEYDGEDVWQAFRKRKLKNLFGEAQDALESNPDQAKAIADGVKSALIDLERESATADVQTAIEKRRFNPQLNPPPIRPVYSVMGVPICTPGNLTTIVAAAKSGKTAWLGAMIAAVIKDADTERDTLGVTAAVNERGLALLHFDTEQSVEDHWHVVTRAMRRVGVRDLPSWFLSYCLTGFDASKAQAAVQFAIQSAAEKFGGVHSVLLDGWADLVSDVNDAEETNAFVARFHEIAIVRNCPVVGILHFNPGSEKSRGHLGSQLERKSETNLRLDKDGQFTEVWSDRQRRAPILKGHGPRFRWDDETQMHVISESGHQARVTIKAAAARESAEEVFNGHPAMRYSALKTTVMSALSVTDRTAERRISEWRELSVIERTVAGLWTLKTSV